MKQHLSATASVAVLIALLPVAAQAQSGEPTVPEVVSVDEVVITGSRLIRDGSQAPTPVTVLSQDALTSSQPASIAEGLKVLPQFQNSSGDRRRQSAAGTGQIGNFLNLRGLGANRGLILMDGRRVPASSPDGAVDTNVIPELLVQRVDVVTGGASAAYGSDAISGVVNYILDQNLVGFRGVIQGGVSTYDDAGTWRAGVAYGGKFLGERLHLVGSAEYSAADPIRTQEARPLQDDRWLFTGAGSAANPWTLTSNTRFSTATNGGLILSGPLANQRFLSDGRVAPSDGGRPTGLVGVAVGGDGGFYGPQWLTGKTQIGKVFGRARYELTDNVELWAEGTYANSLNYNGAGTVDFRLGNITIFNGNAFLRPEVQAALGTTPSFAFGRVNNDVNPSQFWARTEVWDFAGGLRGEFGDGWSWDLLVTKGKATQRAYGDQVRSERFFAAIDAVHDPSGAIVCRVTVTNPGLYPGCVPINLFGEGAPSQAAKEYIRDRSYSKIVNETSNIEYSIRGEPFSLWAGPVGVAAGVQYRELELVQTSTADPATPPPFTGIRGVPAGTSHFFSTNVGVAKGSQTVKEAFGEVNLPLVRDAPFAKSADLNLAARATDYSTSGRVTTWKVGGAWAPTDDIRFRATRSRDIRAPSLFELFAGDQTRIASVLDPHTAQQAVANQVTGGNPNLQPEKADTTTIGVVYSPTWLSGFTASIDYYDIKIDEAMTTLVAATILDNCERSGGAATECSLISRPLPYSDRSPANFPSEIRLSSINAAAFRVKGIDFELAYRANLEQFYAGAPGAIQARLLGSYLDSRKSQTTTVAPIFDLAGQSGAIDNGGGGVSPVSYPKWRGVLVVDYTLGAFTGTLTQRYIGSMKQSKTQVVAEGQNHVPDKHYTDLTLRYRLREGSIEPFVTVNNLFNTQPPLVPINRNVPGAFYPTNTTLYDVIGRYYTAGLRFKF